MNIHDLKSRAIDLEYARRAADVALRRLSVAKVRFAEAANEVDPACFAEFDAWTRAREAAKETEVSE